VTSYQKMKNKRLIYVQTIMNVEVYLSMLRSYLKVRKWISQKSIYDILEETIRKI